MKTKTISFDLPVDTFAALKESPDEFARDIRLTAALKWYEMGIVSQEKAAEIAGISREDFIASLAKLEVSPFQYSADEILEEAGYDVQSFFC
ncbi:MAG: UPF0175 family protein [Candidatus Brocadiia bacterium]